MPWLWHLQTAFVHPLCYFWIRKQDLSLYTFNIRQSTQWLLWAEDKMLTSIQTLYNCLIKEHAHGLCTERFLQETHNTWGVFLPQLTLPDLALVGRALTFHKTCFLKLIQGLSLHRWTCFAGQKPRIILRYFHLKIPQHWKVVKEGFLLLLWNSMLKWCIIKMHVNKHIWEYQSLWEAFHLSWIHQPHWQIPDHHRGSDSATAPRKPALIPKLPSLLPAGACHRQGWPGNSDSHFKQPWTLGEMLHV